MTTGAGNDIERATEMARAMVCEYACRTSDRWPTARTRTDFPRPRPGQHRDFSEDTAIKIDQEVKKFIKPLPAKTDDGVQQVIKPERAPAKGGERPATA